jgi:predicted transcriptional regulator
MREQLVTQFRPHAPGLEAFFGRLEAVLINHLWDAGEASARDCFEMMRDRGQRISYGAVKTVLDRLTVKEVLIRKRADQVYAYRMSYSREAFATRVIGEIMGRLVHDYGEAVYTPLDELDARPVGMRI